MGRRRFSREFKLEAVRLVRERGVSVAQASRDLDIGENILRRWVKEFTSEPGRHFLAKGNSGRSLWRLTGCGVKSPSSRRSATY